MAGRRQQRLAEAVKQAASKVILFELQDPRVKFVTVTKVEVSGDLQYAKIYVSVLGDDADQKTVMDGINHARGYIQRQIASSLRLRHSPIVSFRLDDSVKKSIRISRLIEEAVGDAPAEGMADENG